MAKETKAAEVKGWEFRDGLYHKWFVNHWKEASSPEGCRELDRIAAQRDTAAKQADAALAAELRAQADELEGKSTKPDKE